MTVLAYDGSYVAGDTLITNDSGMRNYSRKLEIFGSQVLASVGAADHGEALMIWFKDGKNPAAFPHVTGQMKDAYLYVFEYERPVMCFQTWPSPIFFRTTEFTAGCGGEIARAALRLKYNAMQAAALACDLNVFCGGDVEFVDLRDLAASGGEVLVYGDD